MNTRLFNSYRQAILEFRGDCRHPSLTLASEGKLQVQYAPFDYLNPTARVVLVGITPGAAQANTALAEAKRCLNAGADEETALRKAKQIGAFSGALRTNLVALLDHIGIGRWLEISSTAALFGSATSLLQTTSALTFPVFVDGANYSGKPDPIATPLLHQQVMENFAPLANALSNAVFIPLGPIPTAVMHWLMREGRLSGTRVLDGLPHPSGANGERIQYFLERKPRAQLSAKTDSGKLDAARRRLMEKVALL